MKSRIIEFCIFAILVLVLYWTIYSYIQTVEARDRISKSFYAFSQEYEDSLLSREMEGYRRGKAEVFDSLREMKLKLEEERKRRKYFEQLKTKSEEDTLNIGGD